MRHLMNNDTENTDLNALFHQQTRMRPNKKRRFGKDVLEDVRIDDYLVEKNNPSNAITDRANNNTNRQSVIRQTPLVFVDDEDVMIECNRPTSNIDYRRVIRDRNKLSNTDTEQEDVGDDDDINFEQVCGDNIVDDANGGEPIDGGSSSHVTEPPQDATQAPNGEAAQIVTIMPWKPHALDNITLDGTNNKYRTKAERVIERFNRGRETPRFRNNTTRVNNISEHGANSNVSEIGIDNTGGVDYDSNSDGDDEHGEREMDDDDNDNEEEEEVDDIVKDMDIRNFGNLGQHSLLDGQSKMDKIKRALLVPNHGSDELLYCRMIADKFNEEIAEPYNIRAKERALAAENDLSIPLGTKRKHGQQCIESYMYKSYIRYWTTHDVLNYRESMVCPVKDYLDIAMGFRSIHKALRGSVVFEHRNETYPDGKPVIKAEEKIFKVVMDSANMYFKFMNAKPQASVYANATRSCLVGLNDISDFKTLTSNTNPTQSVTGGVGRPSKSAPVGKANKGGQAATNTYNHPALDRVKERKSAGAITKTGGYMTNTQVNQYDY